MTLTDQLRLIEEENRRLKMQLDSKNASNNKQVGVIEFYKAREDRHLKLIAMLGELIGTYKNHFHTLHGSAESIAKQERAIAEAEKSEAPIAEIVNAPEHVATLKEKIARIMEHLPEGQMDKPKSDFIADIVAAKKEIRHAILDKTNPHFKSKYASLTSVMDAAVQIYAKHNITIEQRCVRKDDGTWVLRTWREHSSGEVDAVPDEQPLAGETVQQWGSSLTYRRRYGMSTVAGIASEEDDDGEVAMSPAKPKSAYQSRKEGFYPIAEKAIREQTTIEGLKGWWIDNLDYIRELTPSWMEKLQEEKDRRKQQLIDEVAEDSELKKQLKGSLV